MAPVAGVQFMVAEFGVIFELLIGSGGRQLKPWLLSVVKEVMGDRFATTLPFCEHCVLIRT